MASRQELDFKYRNKYCISKDKNKRCSKCMRYMKYNLDIARTEKVQAITRCNAITVQDIAKSKNEILSPLTFDVKDNCICNKFKRR